MRFDDALQTVLAAETQSAFGAQSAWRQLVDLIGRGRVAASDLAIAQLESLRDRVPERVRAASGRAIAFGTPPAGLVRLFASDEPSIAAPVMRAAQLSADDWIALLPAASAPARALLRSRRDLPIEVVRALESFGPSDFALPSAPDPAEPEQVVAVEPAADFEPAATAPVEAVAAIVERAPDPHFTDVASIAKSMPVVAEAIRRTSAEMPSAAPTADLRAPFPIAELVARIDAYTRARDTDGPAAVPAVEEAITSFRFETDAQGIVRWVEGAPREPLIGLALERGSAAARVDNAVAAAARQRQPFADGRLVVAGASAVAGQWRVSASPIFDPLSGRFAGYRGIARRPRTDQRADRGEGAAPPPEALRQLVHELRTPTTAIAGFAEMIDEQILGPVSAAYRDRAAMIRTQASALLNAIEDLDWAARLDSQTLELRPRRVDSAALLARVVDDLNPLMDLRGAALAIEPGTPGLVIDADEVAVERVVSRLLATLTAAAARGETLHVATAREGTQVAITFDRPAAMAGRSGSSLFSIEDGSDGAAGAPLLGTGFALRLARNLAVELGGTLAVGDTQLTLRLPMAAAETAEQLSSR